MTQDIDVNTYKRNWNAAYFLTHWLYNIKKGSEGWESESDDDRNYAHQERFEEKELFWGYNEDNQCRATLSIVI